MASDQSGNPAPDPTLSDGRFLIEIESWVPKLHLGLSPGSTACEDRFQGGLDYIRNVELFGRILAPKAHRGRTIRVWLQPFGPEARFGADEPGGNEVGRLYFHLGAEDADMSAALMLPEASLSFTVTCLASAWRYVHVWTFNGNDDSARISAFSFSSIVHKHLDPRISEA